MLSPFRGFYDAQSEADRLFNEMLGGLSRGGGRHRAGPEAHRDRGLERLGPRREGEGRRGRGTGAPLFVVRKLPSAPRALPRARQQSFSHTRQVSCLLPVVGDIIVRKERNVSTAVYIRRSR